jgi:hypothetical protein
MQCATQFSSNSAKNGVWKPCLITEAPLAPRLSAAARSAAKSAERYPRDAKTNEPSKRAMNAALRAGAGLLSLHAGDAAFALDDEGLASSAAILDGYRGTHQRDKSAFTVLVAQHDAALAARLRASAAKSGLRAVVVHVKAESLLAHLPPSCGGRLRVVALDACCTATTLLRSGMLPAAIQQVAADDASLLEYTACVRDPSLDKPRRTDPDSHSVGSYKTLQCWMHLRCLPVAIHGGPSECRRYHLPCLPVAIHGGHWQSECRRNHLRCLPDSASGHPWRPV